MTDRETLGRRLADVEIPDADAAAVRARALVLDTFETRDVAVSRRRRLPLRLTLGLAGAALLVGVATASPGTSTIIRSVREAVTPRVAKAPKVPVAPLRLPGGGTLLVRRPGSLFVVHADGSRVLLGPYRDAAWSPHARFVVATAGRHLVVLDPRSGAVRWSITAAAPVRGARWSLEPTVPPCCRVAYLTTDAGRTKGSLHVIAGDGTGDHVLAPADARVAPAWRPGSRDRALAFVDLSGAVRLVSADTGSDLANPFWRGFRPTRLAWSADGTRLLAMNGRRLIVLDARLRTVLRILAPSHGDGLVSAAFVPHGDAVVVLRRLDAGRSRVELLPAAGPSRVLETLVGTLSGLAPAPDGHSVLVGWSAAHQWLLVPTGAAATTRRMTGFSAVFGASPVAAGDAWHSTR